MDDIIKSVVYARIDQIMTSDNMVNLIVTLDDKNKFNLKVDADKAEDLFLGCIYQFEVARYSNSEKNNGFITGYKHVTDIEDIAELNSIFRKFMAGATLDYAELKSGVEEYVEKISNKALYDITKSILDDYKNDFYLYPAATKLHHAYIGGLAYHTLGMLRLADGIAPCYPYVSKDLLYAGIILHDIGKVIEFSGIENTEYGMQGQLLGHLLIGCNMIELKARDLGYQGLEEVLMLSHMIASHHGVSQFGAIKKPATAEAALLWYIDTIDSKFRVLGEELERTKEGCFTEPVGVMDRVRFYKHK